MFKYYLNFATNASPPSQTTLHSPLMFHVFHYEITIRILCK